MENHLPSTAVGQIMKCVVLAGGYATRLWPITRHRPKMLLPLGEGTVIDAILRDVEAEARIDEVFISTNRRFKSAFESFLEERSYSKARLSIEETVAEDEKMGVVGALAQLFEREGIVDDDLLIIGGDNLFSFELAEFIDFFEARDAPSLAAYDVESRDAATAYGLVALDGDRVVDFQEKPADPKSTLVSIACYAFPGSVIPRFEAYLSAENNPDEPGWFIQWLQENQAVYAFDFNGTWFDIGTPETYLDAVAWSLNGDRAVADDAEVIDSTLGETVLIGSSARIEGSTLERTIVFDEVTVTGATLTDSIVDEEAAVTDVSLAGARVGAHSRITGDRD